MAYELELIDKAAFEALPEYSLSFPTSPPAGFRWKTQHCGQWFLGQRLSSGRRDQCAGQGGWAVGWTIPVIVRPKPKPKPKVRGWYPIPGSEFESVSCDALLALDNAARALGLSTVVLTDRLKRGTLGQVAVLLADILFCDDSNRRANQPHGGIDDHDHLPKPPMLPPGLRARLEEAVKLFAAP